jgi:hypothetical protein
MFLLHPNNGGIIRISPASLSTNEKDSRAKWLLTKALVSNIYI